MRILINLKPEVLAKISKSDQIKFSQLTSQLQETKNTAAAVIRSDRFEADLSKAVGLGIPLVVVAGSRDAVGEACIEEAQSYGVPDSCIVVKWGNQVCSLDGRVIAPAIRQGRGIGILAVAKAAQFALEKDLRPELVVWEDESEMLNDMPAYEEMPSPQVQPISESPAQPVPPAVEPMQQIEGISKGGFASSFPELLNEADTVIAVFRSVPQANSSHIAVDVARALQGVHLELSASPTSFDQHGATLDSALRSGTYLHSDGTGIQGQYNNTGYLVVEVNLMMENPEAMDMVYQKAKKVVHVVSAEMVEPSRNALSAWIKSGWRLDAIIPDKPQATERFVKEFGKIVHSKTSSLIKSLRPE